MPIPAFKPPSVLCVRPSAVLGCVGLICSASYLSNILAIAAGAILVQTFSGAERVRTLLARGLSGVGDCCGHPMHALNLAIAIIGACRRCVRVEEREGAESFEWMLWPPPSRH